jgi:hypothetical protein
MREVTSSADNLVLFGEMLEVASEYIDRCEELLDTKKHLWSSLRTASFTSSESV